MDHDDKPTGLSRRRFLRGTGSAAVVAATAGASAVALRPGVAEAAPGSPALYFNSFGYAIAGQSIADLVGGIYARFSSTSGFYDVTKGSNYVGVRTINSHGFVEFVNYYPNTTAVVVSAGDDAYTVLQQMVYIIQHTYWL